MEIYRKYIEKTRRRLESMSPDEISRINAEGMRKTDQSYQEFRDSYKKGYCSICNKPLKTFSANTPCLHWLLRPKGFKKKHFPGLFDKYGYFQMECYARWVSNLETPLKNINDIAAERPEKKIFETTIKYKNIEWSFSCSPSDIEGHKNSAVANLPHFHFQMRLDRRPFIDYADFHVPFKEEDLWKLAMLSQSEMPFRHNFTYGEGMQSVLDNEEVVEKVLDASVPASDEAEATLRVDTFVMAKPGQTISGEDMMKLIEESKATGTPIAKLARRLDVDVQAIVSPGDGVPDLAKRSSTKRSGQGET